MISLLIFIQYSFASLNFNIQIKITAFYTFQRIYLVTEIQPLLLNNGGFRRIRKSSHVRYTECRINERWNRIRSSVYTASHGT